MYLIRIEGFLRQNVKYELLLFKSKTFVLQQPCKLQLTGSSISTGEMREIRFSTKWKLSSARKFELTEPVPVTGAEPHHLHYVISHVWRQQVWPGSSVGDDINHSFSIALYILSSSKIQQNSTILILQTPLSWQGRNKAYLWYNFKWNIWNNIIFLFWRHTCCMFCIVQYNVCNYNVGSPILHLSLKV